VVLPCRDEIKGEDGKDDDNTNGLMMVRPNIWLNTSKTKWGGDNDMIEVGNESYYMVIMVNVNEECEISSSNQE